MSVALCPVCRLPCERTGNAKTARCQPCDIEFEAKIFANEAELSQISRRTYHSNPDAPRPISGISQSLPRAPETSRERLRHREGRIRVRCPHCSLMVVIKPKKSQSGGQPDEMPGDRDDEAHDPNMLEAAETEASAFLLDDEEGYDPDLLRLRCPHCERRVELTMRQKPKGEAVETPAPFSPPTPSAIVTAPITASPASRRSPMASPTSRSRRKPVETDTAVTTINVWARELAVPATVFLASAALICSSFESVSMLVLPFALLGGVAGIVALVATIRGKHEWPRPLAAASVGGFVFIMAAAFPGCMGSGYDAYRQPKVESEVTRVVPKKGVPMANVPTEAEWADASLCGLQRNGARVEVVRVTRGPVEVRTEGGGRRTTAESYLVVWINLRRAGSGSEFADNLRKGDSAGPRLKISMFDVAGNEIQAAALDLGMDLAGQNRRSSLSSVVTIEDVAAFPVPAAKFDSLRLEVSAAELGSAPVRFTIPKSMVLNN